MPSRLTCPDCKLDLSTVESGAVTAHRCSRCRGVWLDPGSFRRLCEEESRLSDEDGAHGPSSRPPPPRRPGPPLDAQVRYRACPACNDVMNRSNFGRVSGVVIDVCRAHGAWFDRGELGAIRRFLRDGGLHRFDRTRRADRATDGDLHRAAPTTSPPMESGTLDTIYDVLVGGSGGWDVPSRIPRLLVATVSTALGGGLLWLALDPRWSFDRGLDVGTFFVGLGCLYFAWRALREWAAQGPG